MPVLIIDRQIKDDEDDTEIKGAGWSNKDPYPYFGKVYSTPGGISLRFEDITIPPGSTIKYCCIHLHCSKSSPWIGCKTLVSAEKAADPEKITSYADFMARPRTDRKHSWIPDDPWYSCSTYRSVFLQLIVAELVRAFDYYQAHMQFFFEDDDSPWNMYRYISSYKTAIPQAAILHLTFEPPTFPKRPYWLITKKEHIWTLTGKIITVTTDLPCHLRLRWGDNPPVRHERKTVRRGVADWSDPHWGFDDWVELDQAEIGDTLVHTFAIDPWPDWPKICYYFVGSIQGGDTKSRSPFFHQEKALLTFVLLFQEPWQCPSIGPPPWATIFTEPWQCGPSPPPPWQIIAKETW